MTALSDALEAAQRRSLAAVEKAYVAGAIERDAATESLAECGVTDPVDVSYLLNCLDVLREWGAQVPAETNGKPVDAPSDAQRSLLRDLCGKAGVAVPEVTSKQDASRAITELKAGTYDPQAWAVPF